jgi:Flp pilus assembly protein TadG
MKHLTGHQPTQEDRLIRSRRRAESGQGLVEVALLVPLLVLVLVAVVDFGRIFMVRHVITNASREGARLAVLGDQDSSDVQAEVERYLSGAGLIADKAHITVSGLNASTGQPVVVTVDYSVNSLFLKMIHEDAPIDMNATSTMVHE